MTRESIMTKETQSSTSAKLAILPIWVIDRIKEEMRLGPAAWQAITDAVEQAEVPQALPCEVKLPPGTVIGQGAAVSTLMLAIQQRASQPAHARVFSSVEPNQPQPEPLAWMVGTAFWWTKEAAERDAGATGLPIVGLGPMGGVAPAGQNQGEPVATLLIDEYFDNREVGDVDVQLDTKACEKLAEKYPGQSIPLYAHADPTEVERLKSIERSYGLREALLEQVKGERDRMIARTLELADQLASQDALLRKLKETLQREYWDEYAGLDETRELIDSALSASQEPSTPAAPYPNRLCHIDYTAHPHRCGCLKGDVESQRIYDEHCRTALARQP